MFSVVHHFIYFFMAVKSNLTVSFNYCKLISKSKHLKTSKMQQQNLKKLIYFIVN